MNYELSQACWECRRDPCQCAAVAAPKEAEPVWLANLRNELPQTPMKSGFTLTRDELQYMVDRLAAPSKEAAP